MQDPAKPWIEAARAGDLEAASRLIDHFHEPVYAFLRRLSGSDHDAVELTQRTFCKVWAALAGFEGRSTASSWMHGIAYRTFADWVRAERRRQPMPDAWWASLPDEAEGPDRQSAAAHDRSAIYAEVDRLEPELRDTLHLHYYQGLSIEETAAALEVATSTVKHRVRRALDLIRLAVAPAPIQEPPAGQLNANRA
jgi:RNA polymerase sigma-70 factor, ECF subfamily